jgi:hypothetical protein
MFHSATAKRTVFLTDWHENHRFIQSLVPHGSGESRAIRKRPYLDVAFFWGEHWINDVNTSEGRERLRTERRSQKGRFYRGASGIEPVIVLESAYSASIPYLERRVPSQWYRVTPAGLRILQDHGIVVTEPSSGSFRPTSQRKLGAELLRRDAVPPEQFSRDAGRILEERQ